MRRELALFLGAGGGALASILLGHEIVAGCEIDEFCRSVIFARQRDGSLPSFPTWDDVRTLDGSELRGQVDLVTGGFPCQPFSAAGKRLGEDDSRNMWPDTARVIREVEPRRCFLENVPGLLSSGYFQRVLGDLADMGYRVGWGVLGASAVGARHHRRRLWILADASEVRRERNPRGSTLEVQGRRDATFPRRGRPEPHVGRVVDGVASNLDRSRVAALGNGQVPICAAVAYLLLCRAIGVDP